MKPEPCSCCDGDKIIGNGRTCPNCGGTGVEPENEIDYDPRDKDVEGDPVVPEMRLSDEDLDNLFEEYKAKEKA